MVLLLAIKDHASDLHFEPFENEFKIRIKADGVLYEMVPPPRHLAFAITTRIKVMANLDIAERRLPQDGKIRLAVGGHPVDLRVAVLPTLFGESVVLRVLDKSVVMLDLGAVGMDPITLDAFRQIILRPNGIVLVTGPTGSGKTTTLYAALNELNSIEDKLMTTEDPVEYEMDGIIQIPIDASIGNTFAQCLRSILRQDPDTDSGGRDPRLGDGRDRRPGLAHRAPRLQHLAHQRRPQHDHAAAGHGYPAVLDHRHAGRSSGPAVGAEDLRRLPRGSNAHHGDLGRVGPHARRHDRQAFLPRQRLSDVQQFGQ